MKIDSKFDVKHGGIEAKALYTKINKDLLEILSLLSPNGLKQVQAFGKGLLKSEQKSNIKADKVLYDL